MEDLKPSEILLKVNHFHTLTITKMEMMNGVDTPNQGGTMLMLQLNNYDLNMMNKGLVTTLNH